MTDTLTQQILRQSLDLSYAEIESIHPEWPKNAVDDYFYKQSNINALAVSGQSVEEQVIINAQNISTNSDNIVINAQNLTDHINDTEGAHAASAISYDNTSSGLAADDSQAAIDEVDANLNAHEALESAHGVTGDNIGTEDFAQALIGGAVLLAAVVNSASTSTVSITGPNAPIASPTYNVSDTQINVNLTNELKADVNQLVIDVNNAIAQLNEFLANNKTAKQMASQEITNGLRHTRYFKP